MRGYLHVWRVGLMSNVIGEHTGIFLIILNDPHHIKCIGRGCGLWINKFTVQSCVRKIFISQQQKDILKIAKCQKNRVINSFLYMQKKAYVFSLETLLI